MDTTIQNQDLEQLRAELREFKSRLEKQQIVNQQMIRNAMKQHVTFINQKYLVMTILSVVMIPYCIWLFYFIFHLSIAFSVFTATFFLLTLVYTYFNGKDLRSDRLMEMELTEVGTRVAKAKKLDHDWLKIGIPIAIAWFLWFLIEITGQGNTEIATSMAIGGTIGGIIGAIIGFRVHTQIQKKYQSILDYVEELKRPM